MEFLALIGAFALSYWVIVPVSIFIIFCSLASASFMGVTIGILAWVALFMWYLSLGWVITLASLVGFFVIGMIYAMIVWETEMSNYKDAVSRFVTMVNANPEKDYSGMNLKGNHIINIHYDSNMFRIEKNHRVNYTISDFKPVFDRENRDKFIEWAMAWPLDILTKGLTRLYNFVMIYAGNYINYRINKLFS